MSYSTDHYISTTISRVCVTILLIVLACLSFTELPKAFDSDELKMERLRTERIEMFMERLDSMDEATAKTVLENLENVERAFAVRPMAIPVPKPTPDPESEPAPKIKP